MFIFQATSFEIWLFLEDGTCQQMQNFSTVSLKLAVDLIY